MNDFETRLKELLNENVDERVGARRPPPPFRAPADANHEARRPRPANRAPWVLPLLAAVCVAAVVGATVAATQLLAEQHPSRPGHTGHSSAPVPSLVTTSPLPNTPSPTRVTATPKPGVRAVMLDGAALALPTGWVASGQGLAVDETDLRAAWCLHPRTAGPADCSVEFVEIHSPPVQTQGPIDFDVEHWAFGNAPESCRGGVVGHLERFGQRNFGGRLAEWRRWATTCTDGTRVIVEQYVTATAPVYALFAYHVDASEHPAMAHIVRDSSLPPPSAPLRVFDRGILRSAVRGPDGVTVMIDRVVRAWRDDHFGYVNDSPKTYRYLVPTALFDGSGAHVGDHVSLATDGSSVFQFGTSG